MLPVHHVNLAALHEMLVLPKKITSLQFNELLLYRAEVGDYRGVVVIIDVGGD